MTQRSIPVLVADPTSNHDPDMPDGIAILKASDGMGHWRYYIYDDGKETGHEAWKRPVALRAARKLLDEKQA